VLSYHLCIGGGGGGGGSTQLQRRGGAGTRGRGEECQSVGAGLQYTSGFGTDNNAMQRSFGNAGSEVVFGGGEIRCNKSGNASQSRAFAGT
jgi:hypothetical protein